MKAPKCKLCGFQHWLNEPHVCAKRIDSVEEVQQVAAKVSEGRQANPRVAPAAPSPTVTEPVTKPIGRPRRYKTNAERQRAYRERVSLHWNGTE